MVIVADPDRCVGAGMCALTAPELFDQDDRGVVVVLVPEPAGADRQALARQAVQRCPSGTIRLADAPA